MEVFVEFLGPPMIFVGSSGTGTAGVKEAPDPEWVLFSSEQLLANLYIGSYTQRVIDVNEEKTVPCINDMI